MDEKLLVEIRQYLLLKTGINYFRNIRQLSDNLIVTCPYHKNGQERKPSAGIRITEGEHTPIGMFHCFTCGETKMLSEVLKDLLGTQYNENEVESKFGLKVLSNKQYIQRTPKLKFEIPQKLSRNEIQLKHYREYHPYLLQRGISEDTAIKYDIGFDKINNQITFPIRDINRKCIGVGRRDIYKKMYRYPPGMIKSLYGVYELPSHINYLWIVEGPFNLWSLYEYNKPRCSIIRYRNTNTI